MTPEICSDNQLNLVACFVLGLLPHEDRLNFEKHQQTCSTCRNQVLALNPVMADLADLVKPIAPPPALKGALFQRLGIKSGAQTPAPTVSRTPLKSSQLPWEPSGIPGVHIKKLHIDQTNARVTLLVRMEAGYAYPAHIHAGPEEVYVLEGDFGDNQHTATKGDYIFSDADTQHPRQVTKTGCLLLVRRSLNDTLVHA